MTLPKLLSSVLLGTTLVVGCTSVTPQSKSIDDLLYNACTDGLYDNTDVCVVRNSLSNILENTYLVLNKATYVDAKGKTDVSISLGTANVYMDVGNKTYFTTAKHVVHNDKVATDDYGNEYTLKKTEMYLFTSKELTYINQQRNKDKSIEDILKTMELKPTYVSAEHKELDIAMTYSDNFKHAPLAYKIGDSSQLQPSDKVIVVGYPLGYMLSVNEGKVSSTTGPSIIDDYKDTFTFDASITLGNSGGGVFAVRDGVPELVGITSAMFTRGNDLNLCYKVDRFSELFTTGLNHCYVGWTCR